MQDLSADVEIIEDGIKKIFLEDFILILESRKGDRDIEDFVNSYRRFKYAGENEPQDPERAVKLGREYWKILINA
jgi:hypothetical protein